MNARGLVRLRHAGAAIAVVLVHAATLLLYLLHNVGPDVPQFWAGWTGQVAMLVLGSLVLSVIAGVSDRPAQRAVLFSAQAALFVVAVYGEAGFAVPIYVWGTALAIEAHLLFPVRPALVISVAIAAGAVFLGRAESAWDTELAPRSIAEIVEGATYFSVMIFLTSGYTRLRARARDAEVERERLRDSIMRLTNANVDFQDYAATAEVKGVQDERHRITREIHDMVGYTLTNLIMVTKAGEELIETDPRMLRTLLSDAREQCQQALAEVRRTLRTLWSMKNPEISFPNHAWKTVRTFETATGIEVELELRNLPDIRSQEVRLALLRTLQESLTNAFRHGHASRVTVLFGYTADAISLAIRDNGVGNPNFKEDIGIGGMRERIEPLGGRVFAESPAGGGFEIRAWIPIAIDKKLQQRAIG